MVKDEDIVNLFDKVFKDSGLDYYVDEIQFRHKGTFDIKYYVENLGTVISYYDYEDLQDTLNEVKKKILANPLKCPFCQNLKIKKDCCDNCEAKFMRSTFCHGMDDNLSSYDKFEDFINGISKKIHISKDLIEFYLTFDESIKDLLDGAAVIYEGMNSYPIFVLGKDISIKNKIKPEAKKVFYYCLLAEDEDFNIVYYKEHGYRAKKQAYLEHKSTGIILELDGNLCSIDPIEFNYYIKTLVPFDRDEFFQEYVKYYSLQDNKNDDYLFDLKSELIDWFAEKYFDGILETFNYDEYFSDEIKIPEDLDFENFGVFKVYINEVLKNSNNNIENNIKDAIKNFDDFEPEAQENN